MTSMYEERVLRTLVDDRMRAAQEARAGRAAMLLRRAVRAAAAAHRRVLRADRRAVEAHTPCVRHRAHASRRGALTSWLNRGRPAAAARLGGRRRAGRRRVSRRDG